MYLSSLAIPQSFPAGASAAEVAAWINRLIGDQQIAKVGPDDELRRFTINRVREVFTLGRTRRGTLELIAFVDVTAAIKTLEAAPEPEPETILKIVTRDRRR